MPIFNIKTSFEQGNTQTLKIMKQIDEMFSSEIQDDKYVFSIEDFNENTPFSVLTIASSLKSYRERYPEYKMSLIPRENGDYLSHLGFYDMVGIQYGEKIGEAKPSENYVPIRSIKLDASFYDTIDENAGCLARLLHFDADLEAFLRYAFIEIIRNVYEHAETETAYVCAQKWPSKNLVEIAIVDNGCGVAKAMSKRYPNKKEEELMYLSTMPGVSALSNLKYLDKESTWANTGYGLYALKRLSTLYEGSFILCSGNIALWQKANKMEPCETFFQGTAVAIRIKTNTNNNFQEVRSRVIAEGEKEAKKYGAITRASKSSGGEYRE